MIQSKNCEIYPSSKKRNKRIINNINTKDMASPQEGAQASWGTDIPKQEKATLFSRFRDILHKFREALFSTDPPKDKKE